MSYLRVCCFPSCSFSFIRCSAAPAHRQQRAITAQSGCAMAALPFVEDIGTVFAAAGIVIRLSAVLTLKKAFTLHVQTTAGQQLVTSGLYHTVRHPAYSGSILSLFGVALAFRNIVAVCLVLFCCLICYSTRIRVEEKALEAQFGKEYADYKRSTYRLFPYIF